MKRLSAAVLALCVPTHALLRFQCAQLVIDRLDPLVTPGMAPSPHLHQILGGNAFNTTMDPAKDMPGESTCTSCSFSEDFSNYWTATLYFKAKNGTYKRVTQKPNAGFDGVNGGMTVYYMQDGLYNFNQVSKVTAFKPVRCYPHMLPVADQTRNRAFACSLGTSMRKRKRMLNASGNSRSPACRPSALAILKSSISRLSLALLGS